MATIRQVFAISTALLFATPLFGQGQPGGGGQGGQGGQNQQQAGGILIDAEGIVRSPAAQQVSARLLKERRDAFAAEAYSDDLLTYTDRRCVSLVGLEAECARGLQAGEPLSEDLKYLAGLQRIDFLFIDADSRDIVVAGPAEGFAPDERGRMRGLTTARPPLQLEDLVVALNAAFAGTNSIGCSIDPEPSRLASMGEFIRNNSSVTTPAGAAQRYRRMADILGLQTVSIFGVPEDSHFANVLVEADFRMKRISLGVEPSGVRGLRSHLSLLQPKGNSIQRWWFIPFYDAIYASEDGTAYHLVGQRAQLLAQEELSSLSGERSDAAFTRATTEQFARMFTERFPDLAEHSPVFAQLQNLFDLAVITALLRREDIPASVGWQMQTFLKDARRLTGSYPVPRQVESESTFRKGGRGVVLGLVGGVTIEPDRLLRQFETQAEPALRLNGVRNEALSVPAPADHSWWWD